MSVIEAYAKGVPIISSDVGFVKEFNVEHLFEAGKDDQLAEILNTIYLKMFQRRNKVTDLKYSIFSQKLVDIVRNLLNKKS